MCLMFSPFVYFFVLPTHSVEEKLAESSAANAALSMQLENIAPQLTSLENSLTDSRRQWKEEQRLRRHAEQSQETAEGRLREVEGSIQQMQRENDALHEELAFKESEIEENKLEMEIEKEQLREELEEIRGDLIAKARQLQNTQQNQSQSNGNNTSTMTASPEEDSFRTDPAEAESSAFADDAYAKKLEEELELVTEQLIETEKRLTTTEDKLRASETLAARLESKQQQMDDTSITENQRNLEMLKNLQKENADHLESRHTMSEELELTKEKLRQIETDLRAHEDHEGDLAKNADSLRAEHREEVQKLKMELQELQMEAKTAKSEVAVMEKTLQDSLTNNSSENFKLKEEIAHMNKALDNSKSDYQSLLDELEAVSSRFDEAVQEAERTGRDGATRTLRQEMDAKAMQFKQELQHLTEENATLQSKIDNAELTLGEVKDTQDKNIDNALAQTEMVKKLQSQLVKAKDDLAAKDKELTEMMSGLEERLKSSEENVTALEHELNTTKSKLAETESRMVILRREKGKDTAQSVNRRKLDEYHQDGDGEESRDDISRLQSFETADSRRHGRSRRRTRSNSPCSVDRVGYRLSEESQKLKDLQEEFAALKDQKRMGESRIKRLEEDCRALQQQVTSSSNANTATGGVTQMSRLSSIGASENGMDVMTEQDVGRDRLDEIIDSRDDGLMAEELRGLHHKCTAQREYNAQLLSKMLSLQGNIQVYCRVRTMTVAEIQKGYKGVVEALSETEVGCFDSRTNKWKSYAFDRVWGPDQSQQSVFQDVEPVALSVVDGYNACIFAYGQT